MSVAGGRDKSSKGARRVRSFSLLCSTEFDNNKLVSKLHYSYPAVTKGMEMLSNIKIDKREIQGTESFF